MIMYVGEGNVELGSGKTVPLIASYDSPNRVTILLPDGRETLTVEYRSDDGYRVGQSESPGPSAIFMMSEVPPNESGESRQAVLAARPPAFWWSLGYLTDLAVLLGMLGLYFGALRREWWLPGIIGLLGIGVLYMPEIQWLPKTRAILPVFWFVFASLVLSGRRRRLFSSYFCLAYLSVLRAILFQSNLNKVLIRGGESDFLPYERFARTILETGYLRAGEARLNRRTPLRLVSGAWCPVISRSIPVGWWMTARDTSDWKNSPASKASD